MSVQHKQTVIRSKSVSSIRNKLRNRPHTYISLFSSAGIGCYGFKEEKFECVATVELLERRLKIQAHNKKCRYKSGYIASDLTTDSAKESVRKQLQLWKKKFELTDLDVLIATPPCQGMSVANHKKKDELNRNSLVVESIELTKEIKPRFFIFENVKAFLTSVCTDSDGKDKSIKQAIERNLAGDYNIHFQILNFKDYGSPSSRTRTLVIGVRKDMKEVTPLDLYPDKQQEVTLKQTIGHLPSLKKMGEISPDDIYHNFRNYSPAMEAWIADIGEGESAFDNRDISKIPHTVRDGAIVYNAKKNGGKYTRQRWDAVAPCVHTRNDILASQNTVHPVDNRVFSIRELMLMMSVPAHFKWSDISFDKLNKQTAEEKRLFLKKEEINIRQCLGEAVPTIIFKQIAQKIRLTLDRDSLTEQEIKAVIQRKRLVDQAKLLTFIKQNHSLGFPLLSKIAELANSMRDANAAYYTRQDICYIIIKSLPEAKSFRELRILEPSIGVGNFLPVLISKYQTVTKVVIDVVDINPFSIEVLKELVETLRVPKNIEINYITDDFLLHPFDKQYDIIIGNPPYGKITKDKSLLDRYRAEAKNSDTSNIFAFFIEKSLRLGKIVSLIVPKSLINTPEFNKTRELLVGSRITKLIDFGEKGFKGVKIETVCFIVEPDKAPGVTEIESLVTNNVEKKEQKYITDTRFPYWLIYRDESFDSIADRMQFDIFKAYRDRRITKAITKTTPGKYRVLKSRNIADNRICDIEGYDSYIDEISNLDVSKYLNKTDCVLVPNLTYYPRACFLPMNCIVDGSVAILTTKDEKVRITTKDLSFFGTEEYARFYAIARNRGTRSLNIDNNSVYFFGKLKK